MFLDEFTNAIAVELPGCPPITIERVLRDAVRTHYSVNRLWVHEFTSVAYSDTGVMTLTAPAGSMIVALVTVQDEDGRDYRAEQVGAEFRLKVVPENAQLTVRAQLTMAQGGDELPDAIANRDYELIQSLALSRLMMMPKREWTDIGMAGYHQQRALGLTLAARRVVDGWAEPGTRTVAYGGL